MEIPQGPLPTTRWECPARYMINHRHQDGRPLCMYCECWNPAPFPNGTLPVQPAQASPTIIALSQTSNSQLPIGLPPPVANPSISYEGYNLPPPPVSAINQSSVLDVNNLPIIISSSLIYRTLLIYS